jgi:adenylate cyclase class IV
MLKPGFRALLLRLLQNTFAWYVDGKVNRGHLEVERKFSISAEERESLPLRLRELDFKPAGSVIMTDTFLPRRARGEMLRIRDEMTGGTARSVFTFKTWVSTRDGGKERQEREAQVSPLIRTLTIMLARFICAGELLSFSKERLHFEGRLADRKAVVCLDRVSGLGKFSGFYLEVELIVPLGEDVDRTRLEIFTFVQTLLGAGRVDLKQSYLDMLELCRQT